MGVRVINPEDHGRQITSPQYNASTSTSTQDPWNPENRLSLMLTRWELIALQKSLDEARDYRRRFTFGLVLTACISIGLSLTAFLRTFG